MRAVNAAQAAQALLFDTAFGRCALAWTDRGLSAVVQLAQGWVATVPGIAPAFR